MGVREKTIGRRADSALCVVAALTLAACTRLVSPASGAPLDAAPPIDTRSVDGPADASPADGPAAADAKGGDSPAQQGDLGADSASDTSAPPDIAPPPDTRPRDTRPRVDGTVPSSCNWSNPILGVISPVIIVNSPHREQDPFLHPNGSLLYFSGERSGAGDVYTSQRNGNGTFSAPVLLPKLATSAAEYRFEVTPGQQRVVINANWAGGSGDFDIYESTTLSPTGSFSWSLLSVSSPSREYDPHYARAGLELWFTRNVGGAGHLMVATRPSFAAPFGTPQFATVLHVGQQSGNATLSADGRVAVYTSCTTTNCDIFYALRASPTSTFNKPQPLTAVNTAAYEGEPFIRGDGCELFFVRNNPGTNWDIYRATVAP